MLKFLGNLLTLRYAQSRSLGRNTKVTISPQVPTSHTNKWKMCFFKKRVYLHKVYKLGYKITINTFGINWGHGNKLKTIKTYPDGDQETNTYLLSVSKTGKKGVNKNHNSLLLLSCITTLKNSSTTSEGQQVTEEDEELSNSCHLGCLNGAPPGRSSNQQLDWHSPANTGRRAEHTYLHTEFGVSLGCSDNWKQTRHSCWEWTKNTVTVWDSF